MPQIVYSAIVSGTPEVGVRVRGRSSIVPSYEAPWNGGSIKYRRSIGGNHYLAHGQVMGAGDRDGGLDGVGTGAGTGTRSGRVAIGVGLMLGVGVRVELLSNPTPNP